jgi:hypothetical protein
MIASLFLGTPVARSWRAITPVDQTPSGAQLGPWAVTTWGRAFGCTPSGPRGRLAAATGDSGGTATNCRSRDAIAESGEAKSKKCESGYGPHFFHGWSLPCSVSYSCDASPRVSRTRAVVCLVGSLVSRSFAALKVPNCVEQGGNASFVQDYSPRRPAPMLRLVPKPCSAQRVTDSI